MTIHHLDNENVRKSISATLSEIEQAPWQWQQLSDVVEALQIIQRIERRLNVYFQDNDLHEFDNHGAQELEPQSSDYWQGVRWPNAT